MKKSIFLLFAFIIISISCKDEEPALPDNLIQFESTETGLSADEKEMIIKLILSRKTYQDLIVTIATQSANAEYNKEYVTEPASESGNITVAIPKGASEGSFKIIKKTDALFDGDEVVSFTTTAVSTPAIIGEKASLKLNFAELLATEGEMDPNVGGSLQPNKVFVDLSAIRQTVIERNKWDLGLYMENGIFRATLNSSVNSLVKSLYKTDLNAVTAADTVGFASQLSTESIFAAIIEDTPPSWISQSKSWIDDPSGDVSKTAIAEVASIEADNKVYIINRGSNPDGTPRGWKKIKVIRNGNNYTVQHADIAATSFQSINVERNNDYLFSYISFEQGVVTVEPKKDKWDIAFTVFINTTPLDATTSVPYIFQDMVIQNRYSTGTVQILNSSGKTYDDFTEADLAGITFSSSQTGIGSGWRVTGGPGGTQPSVRADRFYLIKDADNNIYKLKFTALTQNGERGRPKIAFKLLKRGA